MDASFLRQRKKHLPADFISAFGDKDSGTDAMLKGLRVMNTVFFFVPWDPRLLLFCGLESGAAGGNPGCAPSFSGNISPAKTFVNKPGEQKSTFRKPEHFVI